jgi:hypothetical protein
MALHHIATIPFCSAKQGEPMFQFLRKYLHFSTSPSQEANLPPLTASCVKLSAPENLLAMADKMTSDRSGKIDNRASVLCFVIMAAAGDFVGGLLEPQKERGEWGEESRRYLRDTNLDVITAEAIVWIHFLMGRRWEADQQKDREMFERIGYSTTGEAFQLVLGFIEKLTGVDFKARAVESRMLYSRATKDRSVSFEPFATTVLRSAGCRSLTEPLSALSPVAWTPPFITIRVGIFYSTMPSAFYETFKNFLREWPGRFPSDDDEDFDG